MLSNAGGRPNVSSLAIILIAVFWVSLLTAITVYFYPRHINTLYLQNTYISSSHTNPQLATIPHSSEQQSHRVATLADDDDTVEQQPCPDVSPAVLTTTTSTKEDSGLAHFYHMCAPDHIGAQPKSTPRPPLVHAASTTTSSNHPSTEANLARLREFDGTGHAYYWADVWPTISQGNISLQTPDNYYRVYVMEFNVDQSRRLVTFNMVRETKHEPGFYEYHWVGGDLLPWWTKHSPDVQLECAHAYGSDSTAVELVTDAFTDNDRNPQLHCHYSTTVDTQNRIPTFTTLRFRSKHVGNAPQTFPTTLAEFAGKKWQDRWKAAPDFTFTLPWCRASRPRVYMTAFIKPAFGDPIYIGEMLLNYIHWHRVIGVDHFYVFDRYGQMLPTSEKMTSEWKTKYAGVAGSDAWQFYSLADYIRAGVVTYIPSPCQHDDPKLCDRYQDHLPTGETSLSLARQHTQWMLQSDLDEFVNLMPRMQRPDAKGEIEQWTPFTSLQINEHAQRNSVKTSYYQRECGNSLYCKSPIRDFLDQYMRFGIVQYRTWNVAVAPPVLDDSEVAQMRKEKAAGAVGLEDVDIDAMVARRHWLISHWVYKDTEWAGMHEKYICQPRLTYEWGVHGARTNLLEDMTYLMPDKGIFMAHYKWQWETNVSTGAQDSGFAKHRDIVIATVMDTINQPKLQPLNCGAKDCGWNGEDLSASVTQVN